MSEPSFIIYKSSAGSGKTYTLVLEYLRHVIRRPQLYRQILAITFTNKATEEMKTRIVEALAGLSQSPSSDLLDPLCRDTGFTPAQVAERAGKVLGYILHDYNRFSVSTIDSFFAGLVRSLARELRIPVRFDLELDTKAVAASITQMLFADISKNPALREWLEKFLFSKLDQDKGWQIAGDIRDLAVQLFTDSYRDHFGNTPHKITPSFVNELRQMLREFEGKMKKQSEKFSKVLLENNLTIKDILYGKAGAAGYMEKIGKSLDPESYFPGSRFLRACEDPDAIFKLQKDGGGGTESARAAIQKVLIDTHSIVEHDSKKYVTAAVVLENIYQAGIFGELDEKLKLFRQENELLLISDTNRLLRETISGQDAPFVYEKSGNRYSHFMLDEFQDTSDFQWSNMLPLVEHALGSGNFAMLVGDVKQSIYRWRGGNMELLMDGVQQQLSQFREITGVRHLAQNYRSRERIVDFNNTFFSLAQTKFFSADNPFRHAYESGSLNQEWRKGKAGDGFVQIRFSDPVAKTPLSEDPEQPAWMEQSEAWCLDLINQLLSEGYRYQDIAILTRKNSDAKQITNFLHRNGITRIVSPESLQLYGSPAIRMLVGALQLIEHPADLVALASTTFNYVRFASGNPDWQGPLPGKGFRDNTYAELPEAFKNKIRDFRSMPLYGAVEELMQAFGLTKPDAYLTRFLDVVLDYEKKQPSNITDFLAWWEEHKDGEKCALISPSDDDALRVMTIHKSKGLQFPVVIMPYLQWKILPGKSQYMWVTTTEAPFSEVPAHLVRFKKLMARSYFEADYFRELQSIYMDQINLMYVAFTRAEERLYLSAMTGSRNDKGEFGHAGAVVQEIASNMEGYRPDEGLFESGQPQPPARPDRPVSRTMHPIQSWVSVPWKERIHMAVNKHKISLADPELSDTGYGLLFHQLMTGISEEVDALAYIQSNPETAALEENIRNKLVKDTAFYMQAAREYGWLDPDAQSINEGEILMPDGSIYRPDKIILKQNSATVVDFKTGDRKENHDDQVRRYAEVLEQMGYKIGGLFLVYPELRSVMQVNRFS